MHDLHPYVPGEQPPVLDLVKLNTNESPFGPSPRVLDAIRAEAAQTLRLYPDPEATGLRRALASYHGVRPEQVFAGNGSDEVLAHAFVALLKQNAPLLLPDITYGIYPAYCRLFGIQRTRCRSTHLCTSASQTIRDLAEPSSPRTQMLRPASLSRRDRSAVGRTP